VHAAAAAQLTSLSEDACSLSELPFVSADFCYIQLPSLIMALVPIRREMKVLPIFSYAQWCNLS
jgi:hypothetical protein